MNKILLIIQREYLSRVKKKSFMVMTILGPILMGGLVLAPYFLSKISDEKKTIEVVDESGLFEGKLPDGETIHFEFLNKPISEAKKDLKKDENTVVLYIPSNVRTSPDSVTMFSEKQSSLNTVDYIERLIQKKLEADKLVASGINQQVLDSAKTEVNIQSYKITEKGEESSNAGVTTMIGFIGGGLIYFFIFLYGAQVMRGVIEEKTSRIVEVIISSVKPFQLMMGKIIGIALVALTQFVLWIILTTTIANFVTNKITKNDTPKKAKTEIVQNKGGSHNDEVKAEEDPFAMLRNQNIPLIISIFVFYFIGGYLLYSALFAAVGSAVDSESDTQQFMLPITLPLIFSFMIAQYVITSPEGPIAFWFSIIPLTSPVVMMVRIPFGVPVQEILLSMGTLIAGFIGTVWIAAKIYRTGILMYGKKPTLKEIGKWLFYKG